MVDTPLGVPSDGSRGGMGAPSRVDVSVAEKLRNLADWLDAHPGVNVTDVTFYSDDTEIRDISPDTAEDLLATTRAVGGKWEKIASEKSELFTLRQEVMPGYTLKLVAWRSEVCTRVVTGTREVEVPDPAAPTVTRTEDVVEWVCEPLLARDAAA